ncbi:41649_t:CDS:1, partial [Gigaspora margarita]
SNLSERWKSRFQPIKELNPSWYKPLLEEVTEKKWQEALEQTKS